MHEQGHRLVIQHKTSHLEASMSQGVSNCYYKAWVPVCSKQSPSEQQGIPFGESETTPEACKASKSDELPRCFTGASCNETVEIYCSKPNTSGVQSQVLQGFLSLFHVGVISV